MSRRRPIRLTMRTSVRASVRPAVRTPMPHRVRPHGTPRRGVALVLVLWLVVILGGIGATVVSSTRDASRLAGNARARVVARYAAESGIEATLAAIDDSLALLTDSTARRAFLNSLEPDSRGDSVALGDARFAVAIVDASARLDVNAAPAENLARLFERFADPGRARALARAIRGRIEAGDGRTITPLRSLEELRSIAGADDRLLQLSAPYLTVDGDGTINRAAASDTVMAAAFGELRDAPARLVVISRGWMRGHPLTHEIQGVYAVASDRLVLVHWRERTL
ncbi:MAG TPA: type II secretion system protein GspK [Gemmatimonadaceae bacterium]|nr:type II secretion system protein GspK [Gemmatimonadaceae bacterium]